MDFFVFCGSCIGLYFAYSQDFKATIASSSWEYFWPARYLLVGGILCGVIAELWTNFQRKLRSSPFYTVLDWLFFGYFAFGTTRIMLAISIAGLLCSAGLTYQLFKYKNKPKKKDPPSTTQRYVSYAMLFIFVGGFIWWQIYLDGQYLKRQNAEAVVANQWMDTQIATAKKATSDPNSAVF